MSQQQIKTNQHGYITPTILAIIIVFSIVTAAIMQLIGLNMATVNGNIKSQKAFNIAEAGINYYLWHLSHNPGDYKDGGTTPASPNATLGYGPYVHTYMDDNATYPGTFTLWISPEGGGSTIVKIRSIGKVTGSNIVRTIDAQIGSPSFASYSVAADTSLWFGNTETATGPVHSNEGVRMDGQNTSDVTSANTTYVPSNSLGGDGSAHPGVWCNSSITSPVNCNTRPKTDWQYPIASLDFNQVTASLCSMKKSAFASDSTTSALASQSNACSQTPKTRTDAYVPQYKTNGSYSADQGYLIVLNSNNTYNLYKVTDQTDTASSYSSALSLSSVQNNISLPANGVIFVEDNVWVRSNPTFKGRLTIGAGRLATTNNAQITIADDIVYSAKDGSDALGLISESNVTIAPYAPPQSGAFTFEVDAAVIAPTGSVLYPSNYTSGSGTCTTGWNRNDQTLLFYGSVASRLSWTWTWSMGYNCGDAVPNTSGGGYISGILHNNTQYDYNLLYAPPPQFPTTSTYNVISWREVLTAP